MKFNIFGSLALLKKTEIALTFTREKLSSESALNLTYQEGFSKVGDQVNRLQREKVSLIQEMASLRLPLEEHIAPRPASLSSTGAKCCEPHSARDKDIADLRSTVESLAQTVVGADTSWTEVVKRKNKGKAENHTQSDQRQQAKEPVSNATPTPSQPTNTSQTKEQAKISKTYLLGASIFRDVNPRGLSNTTVRSLSGATNERFKQELEGTDLTEYDNVVIQGLHQQHMLDSCLQEDCCQPGEDSEGQGPQGSAHTVLCLPQR